MYSCLAHLSHSHHITCTNHLCPLFLFFLVFAGYKNYNTNRESKTLFSVYFVVRLFAQFTPFFCLICCAISRDNNQCFDLNSREHSQSKIMSANQRYFRTSFWTHNNNKKYKKIHSIWFITDRWRWLAWYFMWQQEQRVRLRYTFAM